MKRLRNIGAGAAILAASTFAPVIPEDLTFAYAYQYKTSEKVERTIEVPPVVAGSSSPAVPVIEEEPDFPDTDRNGLVSVAVFIDSNGNKVFVPIPDALYETMGKVDGSRHNPTKQGYQSLFESLRNPNQADAAVAFDASSSGSTNAISLTVAHTVTGSAPTLFVVVRDLDNTLSTVTYNGVGMTQVGSTQGCGGNNISTWRLLGPSTGTNNIVATKASGTSNLRISATSYTGTNQSALDASQQNTAGSVSNWSQSLTTVTDGAWVVAAVCNNAGATNTAGANTTLRVENNGFNAIYDSNAAVSPPASRTLNYQSSVLPDVWAGTIVALAPGAAVVPALVDDTYFDVSDEW